MPLLAAVSSVTRPGAVRSWAISGALAEPPVADSHNYRPTSAGPSCRRTMWPKQVSAYGTRPRQALRYRGPRRSARPAGVHPGTAGRAPQAVVRRTVGARRQVDAAGAGRQLTAVGTVVDRNRDAGVDGRDGSESRRARWHGAVRMRGDLQADGRPGRNGPSSRPGTSRGQPTPAAAAARRSRISADAASSMTKMAVMMITTSMATSTYLPSV